MHTRDWRLIEDLASDDVQVRSNAMRGLDIEDEAQLAPFLIDCLAGYYPKVQAAATHTLSKMDGGDGVFLVVNALAARDMLGYSAARAMQQLDDQRPLIRHIRELVNPEHMWSDDREPRIEATSALARLGDVRAIPALVYALRDVERNVRAEAADALGELGDDAAVGPLARVLEDDWNYRPQVHAVSALVRIGSDSAWTALLDRLQLLAPDRAYYAALWELEKAQEPRAIPALLKVMESGLDGMMAESEGVASAAAYTLTRLGHTEVVDRLIVELEAAPTYPWRRPKAARVLGVVGDGRAVEPLIGALRDDNVRTRSEAAYALGELGDIRAVGPLDELLGDEEPKVRCRVESALDRLRQSSVTE